MIDALLVCSTLDSMRYINPSFPRDPVLKYNHFIGALYAPQRHIIFTPIIADGKGNLSVYNVGFGYTRDVSAVHEIERIIRTELDTSFSHVPHHFSIESENITAAIKEFNSLSSMGVKDYSLVETMLRKSVKS